MQRERKLIFISAHNTVIYPYHYDHYESLGRSPTEWDEEGVQVI